MMMMMDHMSVVATPPHLSSSAGLAAPSSLPSKPSMASLRSVFTLSVCTAPVRNDKTHPVPSIRCPHCLETVTVADLASMLLKDGPARVSVNHGDLVPAENSHNAKKGNLKLQTTGTGLDCVGCLVVDSAASNLLKTLHETNHELQTHCHDLHQLRLASPSPSSSRRGSLDSLESSKASSIASLDESHPSTVAGSVESGEKVQPRGRTFESGHPLISDLGDLANLSNANFRLLKTLQDKVNKVDSAEKMLRAEREAIERERALLRKMSAEVEKERVRLMNGGLGWEGYKVCSPPSSHGLMLKHRLTNFRQMDISRTQSALTMMRTRSGGVTPDGTWDDMNYGVAIFDEEWTEEKEQHLALLEQKLKKANRQWSDEQEEILEPVSCPCFFLFLFYFTQTVLTSISLPAREIARRETSRNEDQEIFNQD